VNEAREAVLAAVRGALADRPHPGPDAEDPPYAPVLDPASLFAERVREYRAEVRRVTPGGIADAVCAVCVEHAVRRLATPSDLVSAWLPAGIEVVADAETAADLDTIDGVLTGCALAIATTGTIVLDGGPGQGTRAQTLVPDLHICVVATEQVVAGVADAIAHLHAEVMGRRAPVTLISGPSATSDIELSRIEGVHGPRRLVVLLTD
jgi:L-lactate dehydrogenase complex protein LldG